MFICVSLQTSSSALAERPRDASCLSVVSFNSTIPRAHFLSVQCYSWTEYKFTSVCVSVCVCVCVSVTLSANSHTGQTPQRIFTVDSLKDADLHKDMPFGDDE